MRDMSPPHTPYILVTNDDGILTPTLALLAQHLRGVAEALVLAPDHNWSAAGHSKTMHKPLRVWPADLADGTPGLASSGSPSDCVALVLLGLIEPPPSLVVSGINLGANVGHDLTYSGTVAAAMEAVIGGVPGIAVSLDSVEAQHPESAARFAAQLAAEVLRRTTNKPLLLNVNVPDLPEEQIAAVEITRQGNRLYHDALITRVDPRGRTTYWIGGEPPEGIPAKGTDIGALAKGHISVTPVRLDLTDRTLISELRQWELQPPGSAQARKVPS